MEITAINTGSEHRRRRVRISPCAAVSARRRFACESAEHSSLDGQYLELLPELYTNELTQVVQRIRCEPPGRSAPPDHRCSGPATVILEVHTDANGVHEWP